MIPLPDMEQKVETIAAQPTVDAFELIAWAHENRKQLITVASVIAVLGVIIGGYILYNQNREESANVAVAAIKVPNPGVEPSGADAAGFLKVAADYQGTKAAERALLQAAGILFEAGKFEDSRTAFDQYMNQYSSSGLAAQALLGIAACLEAQGKTSDAATRYEDILKHGNVDAIAPQVRSALARCYVALNKNQQAYDTYQEMIKHAGNDTWSYEANIQIHELVEKHPELVKPKASALTGMANPATAPTSSMPVVPIPTRKTN